MNNKALVVNKIRRTIGQLTIQVGVKQIWEAISDFSDTEGGFDRFRRPLFGLPVSQMDEVYYFMNWNNWLKVIETLNPILKNFSWKKERFDCDERAMLVVALTALLFEVNTVRPVYCSVHNVSNNQFAGYHYANIIVDDAGNVYLWDADQKGIFQKITTVNPIMGNWKYNLIAVK